MYDRTTESPKKIFYGLKRTHQIPLMAFPENNENTKLIKRETKNLVRRKTAQLYQHLRDQRNQLHCNEKHYHELQKPSRMENIDFC